MRWSKKSTVLLGLLAMLLLFMAVDRAVHEQEHPFHSEAEMEAFLEARGAGLPSTIGDYFSGSGRCEGCHGKDFNAFASLDAQGNDVNVVDDWRSTMMANSARDPFWRAKVSHELLVNPSHQSDLENKCTTCHAPMGNFEKHLNGGGPYTLADLDTDGLGIDGVSCLACHMQSQDSIGQLFSGNLRFDSAMAYGPYMNMFASPMISFVGYNPQFASHVTDGTFCAGCHTLITQTVDLQGNYTGNDFVEQATYHEWVNSVYENTVSCQSCHVPRINDAVVISANYLFLTGHSPYGLHHFQGANTFMLQILRENIQDLGLTADTTQFDSTIARTNRMLQHQTLMMDLSLPVRTPDTAFIDVELVNLAGHKFPSGYPSRRAFVELVVLDDNLDTLFKSGVLQSDYEVEGHNTTWEPHYDVITQTNQVQIYEHVLGDVNGDKTTVLERANANLKDNRLVPSGFSTSHSAYDTTQITNVPASDTDFNFDAMGVEGSGSDVVHYHVPLNGYSGEIAISARVYYQSAPPAWMAEMFSFNSAEIDSFRTMYDNSDQMPILIVQDTLVDNTTSVLGLADLGFSIGPNPSLDGVIAVQGPMELVEMIEVFDMNGKVVDVVRPWGNIHRFKLLPGSYLLRFQHQRGAISERLIIL